MVMKYKTQVPLAPGNLNASVDIEFQVRSVWEVNQFLVLNTSYFHYTPTCAKSDNFYFNSRLAKT